MFLGFGKNVFYMQSFDSKNILFGQENVCFYMLRGLTILARVHARFYGACGQTVALSTVFLYFLAAAAAKSL